MTLPPFPSPLQKLEIDQAYIFSQSNGSFSIGAEFCFACLARPGEALNCFVNFGKACVFCFSPAD